jgi:hypothetical protein
MKSAIRLLSLVTFPLLTMTGCGSLNLGQAVQVSLDPATQSAKLEVELSDGFQVNMAGQYLIEENWGRIYFVQPTKTTNAKIGVEVSVASIAGSSLNFSTISALPNGAPLPVAVSGPLFAIPVLHDANFDLKAAVSITPELQVGALVGIQAFSTKYVIPGVAVCQNFRNSAKVAFAAICIYGPSASGKDSGGIFLGGSFGQVIPSSILNSSQPASGSVALASRSSVFALSAAPALSLNPMNMSATAFDQVTFDPKKQMMTSQGQKSLNNVLKVLKVRN